MKITLCQDGSEELELILRCKDKADPQVQKVLALLQYDTKKLIAFKEKTLVVLNPEEVLYCEFIDNTVFVYTQQDIYTTRSSLTQLEGEFAAQGFFRCSKNMVLNLMKISTLRSDVGGKLIVCLLNQEKLIVSRKYAHALREKIKS